MTRRTPALLAVLGSSWLVGCSAPEPAKGSPSGASGAPSATGGANAAGVGGAGAAGSAGSGGTGAPVGGAGGAAGGSGGSAGTATGGQSGSAGTATGGSAGRAGAASGGAGAAGASGGSSGGSAGTSGAGAGSGGVGGAGGEIVLGRTPGTYRQTCDGSLGVFLDADHFLDGNDENQGLRVYRRGADANPVATLDVSTSLGLATSDEADLEDAARVGNRIYVVSSHGRDSDGNLERERYRFFAADIGGTSPNVTLTGVGYSSTLLDQMLVASNWTTPSTAVISALSSASNLSASEDEDLAPKANGTSIEGLAWAPTAANPERLLVGFRNPTQGSNAIVVSLLNPGAVVTGTTARFGEATLLDLGGLGLRAMTWSPLHQAVLLVAGPKAGGGPFRLFRWSGPPSTTLAAVQDIDGVPADSSPEAIVVYPNTRDIQILFDQGDHLVGATICKDVAASSRSFSDVILHVP